MSNDKDDTIEMLLETCLKQRRQIKELEEGVRRREAAGYQRVSSPYTLDKELTDIALAAHVENKTRRYHALPENVIDKELADIAISLQGLTRPFVTLMEAVGLVAYSQRTFVSNTRPQATIISEVGHVAVYIPTGLDLTCEGLAQWAEAATKD